MRVDKLPIVAKVESYCKKESGLLNLVSFLITNSESEAQKIVKEIFVTLNGLSPTPRVLFKKKLSAIFRGDEIDGTKVTLLQTALSRIGQTSDWKGAILERLDLFNCFFAYPNQLDQPFVFDQRFQYFCKGSFSAYLGSTFFTNKPHRMTDKGNHIFDAVFALHCFDQLEQPSGYAFALGDGAGGHFGDEQEDKWIAYAAHLATKQAVKTFATYDSPEKLRKELQPIAYHINELVKTQCRGSGTTLAVCRAFPDPNGHRLIGFNLGDGMLVGWNPMNKKTYPIFSAKNGKWGSAHFPMLTESNEELARQELEVKDIIVPRGTLLFMMSDGIHDMLPYEVREEKGENGAEYTIRTTVSLSEILEKVNSLSPPATFLKTLTEYVCQQAEKKRVEEIGIEKGRKEEEKKLVQLGDDCSLLICPL